MSGLARRHRGRRRRRLLGVRRRFAPGAAPQPAIERASAPTRRSPSEPSLVLLHRCRRLSHRRRQPVFSALLQERPQRHRARDRGGDPHRERCIQHRPAQALRRAPRPSGRPRRRRRRRGRRRRSCRPRRRRRPSTRTDAVGARGERAVGAERDDRAAARARPAPRGGLRGRPAPVSSRASRSLTSSARAPLQLGGQLAAGERSRVDVADRRRRARAPAGASARRGIESTTARGSTRGELGGGRRPRPGRRSPSRGRRRSA